MLNPDQVRIEQLESSLTAICTELTRIAAALERLAPVPEANPDFSESNAFVWDARKRGFTPVTAIHAVDLPLLQGVDFQRDALLRNSRMFASGRQANNVLLWGARGTGKSSLVKGVHKLVESEFPEKLVLVEIPRDHLSSLPEMLTYLRESTKRFIVFSDDLSFEPDESAYKSLKAVLDGGIEGRPDNVIFYATSNRRHLLSRDLIENEKSTAINPGEAVEEKVSLSDRFGLWLGFHATSQEAYLSMIHQYADYYGCTKDRETLTFEALQWSATRGSRSGRIAFQFMQDVLSRE